MKGKGKLSFESNRPTIHCVQSGRRLLVDDEFFRSAARFASERHKTLLPFLGFSHCQRHYGPAAKARGVPHPCLMDRAENPGRASWRPPFLIGNQLAKQEVVARRPLGPVPVASGAMRLKDSAAVQNMHKKTTWGRADLGAFRRIMVWHRANATSKQLDAIPGVGPALATAFRSGRDFLGWVGLVPKQTRAARYPIGRLSWRPLSFVHFLARGRELSARSCSTFELTQLDEQELKVIVCHRGRMLTINRRL